MFKAKSRITSTQAILSAVLATSPFAAAQSQNSNSAGDFGSNHGHSGDHSHTPTLPFFILCQETSPQINGWSGVHLFSFTKLDGFYALGEYKRYDLSSPDPRAGGVRYKSNKGKGKASIQGNEGDDPDLFSLNALSYPLPREGLNREMPNFIFGAEISTKKGVESNINLIMGSDLHYQQIEQKAKCRRVTQKEANQFKFD